MKKYFFDWVGKRVGRKTERKIFDLYIEGKSSAEILQLLEIKENTLKYHNKNIYSKMEISKRKELIEQGRKYV